ncbi:MAG: hypothetical protein E6H00_07505 [Bacillati bacterium ANGP1]|uniref:Uncharacterized protein n=1 Tax=Candidatus Segetimicrobium genomatis TaxID=2569760 RepID=A0A537K3C8_9BACT|nr:MAG: hypothetical protein E6H00_07505 [Terrabacteria group bacterium ANGP1]
MLAPARPPRLLPTRLAMPTYAHPRRRPRPRPYGPSRRSSRAARRGARPGVEPWRTTRSGVPIDGKRLWERWGDDRELTGVKIALLGALLILAAALEWVV